MSTRGASGSDVLDQVPSWAVVVFCCSVLVFGLLSVLGRPTLVRLREATLWTGIALAVLGTLAREAWIIVLLILVFASLVISEVARRIRRHRLSTGDEWAEGPGNARSSAEG